jgi:hypothetical protein
MKLAFSTLLGATSLSLLFFAHGVTANTFSLTDPEEHQPIRAEIINEDPDKFTIDVHFFKNLFADKQADTFAVYIADDLPEKCGDFSSLELAYQKPEDHLRIFNLSQHPEVLDAIEKYGCVVVPNISGSADQQETARPRPAYNQ